MGDLIAIDTEVMVHLGSPLDFNIDNVEVINEKIDNVIEVTDKLKNSTKTESIVCECGGKFVNRNKTRHMKTKMHQSWVEKFTQTLPSATSC